MSKLENVAFAIAIGLLVIGSAIGLFFVDDISGSFF